MGYQAVSSDWNLMGSGVMAPHQVVRRLPWTLAVNIKKKKNLCKLMVHSLYMLNGIVRLEH